MHSRLTACVVSKQSQKANLKGAKMKTVCVRRLLTIMVLLCALHPAWAAWTSAASMGTTVVLSDPSCASPSTGLAVCAARGVGQTLIVNQWSGTKWAVWKTIAGTVTSNPSCAADGAGSVICGVRNATGGLSAAVYNGTTWGVLTSVGGTLTSEPSCAQLTVGDVLCVGRSTAGGYTSSFFNGTVWSAFKTLAGTTVSAPGCGSDGTGGVVCISTSTTDSWSVVAARFAGAAWSTFINIGGSSGAGRYSCTPLGGTLGLLTCFSRGSGGGLFADNYKGGAWAATSWSGWGGLGGNVNPGSSCAQTATGELACGSVASDAGLWVTSFNGTSWSGWLKIGTATYNGNPGCASIEGGKVLCAVVGVNGKAVSTIGP
jgi:hypothetical protein